MAVRTQQLWRPRIITPGLGVFHDLFTVPAGRTALLKRTYSWNFSTSFSGQAHWYVFDASVGVRVKFDSLFIASADSVQAEYSLAGQPGQIFQVEWIISGPAATVLVTVGSGSLLMGVSPP